MFHGTPNRINLDGPRVTLDPRSVFLLNTAAYEMLGGPAAVALGYDENTRTIGIVPKDPRNRTAFPVKGKVNNKRYTYRVIHAAPFCRHFEIRPKRTILFTGVDLMETPDGGFVVLEVSAFGGFRGLSVACGIDAAPLLAEVVMRRVQEGR